MKNQFNDSEMRAKLFLCLKAILLMLFSSQMGNSKMDLGIDQYTQKDVTILYQVPIRLTFHY